MNFWREPLFVNQDTECETAITHGLEGTSSVFSVKGKIISQNFYTGKRETISRNGGMEITVLDKFEGVWISRLFKLPCFKIWSIWGFRFLSQSY